MKTNYVKKGDLIRLRREDRVYLSHVGLFGIILHVYPFHDNRLSLLNDDFLASDYVTYEVYIQGRGQMKLMRYEFDLVETNVS